MKKLARMKKRIKVLLKKSLKMTSLRRKQMSRKKLKVKLRMILNLKTKNNPKIRLMKSILPKRKNLKRMLKR